MEQQPKGQKIRVTLRQVQILDRKEPFFKRFGEIRFRARVSTRDNGGQTVETFIPEEGVYRITDQPGHNILPMNIPIFEGFVEDHLEVELTAVERDTLSRDDKFNEYRRVHTGPPETWIGRFGPGDEEVEPEDVGDWRVWYRIEKVDA